MVTRYSADEAYLRPCTITHEVTRLSTIEANQASIPWINHKRQILRNHHTLPPALLSPPVSAAADGVVAVAVAGEVVAAEDAVGSAAAVEVVVGEELPEDEQPDEHLPAIPPAGSADEGTLPDLVEVASGGAAVVGVAALAARPSDLLPPSNP